MCTRAPQEPCESSTHTNRKRRCSTVFIPLGECDSTVEDFAVARARKHILIESSTVEGYHVAYVFRYCGSNVSEVYDFDSCATDALFLADL